MGAAARVAGAPAVSPAARWARPDGTYPSTCWECGTVCGSLVTVAGGRVVRVGPNPAHPASRGAFCVKGILGAPGWRDADRRLLHPLRRAGARGEGRWERIAWDEALDLTFETSTA